MKLFDLVGNTPLVEIQVLNPNPGVTLYGKLEGQNPGGSVKDRAALNMIRKAMERGELREGDRLIEATSGNTGIALAMIARLLGLEITLVMPENATVERRQAMQAYGAEVILTPADRTIEYSRELAEELSRKKGYRILDQFNNSDNEDMHYRTTGPEIWRDTGGKVTHFVSAMGTTGTIMGVSRYLKEMKSEVQIVGTQPAEGSSIPGIRRWTPEFLPGIYEPNRVDRLIFVDEDQAAERARELASREAIFSGMSSGGAFQAAIQLASELDRGVIVFIVCDRGDRYLSSGLFGDEPSRS